MKRTALLTLFIVAIIAISCEKAKNPYADLNAETLGKLAAEKYEAILALANPVPCTDAKEWEITEIQTICGRSYIAYHESVDKKRLQSRIADYHQVVEIYGPIMAPVINCMPYRKPLGVVCEDGKAIVEFEPFENQ